MLIIRDGTGKGYDAKVNYKNRLSVSSETLSRVHEKTLSGETFAIGTSVFEIDATTTGTLFYFNFYDTSQYFAIEDLWFLWNGGDTSKVSSATFIQTVIVTEPTSNLTSANVINTNFGSTKEANIYSYVWDGVGTGMSGGYIVDSAPYIIAPGTHKYNVGGSYVLGPQTKLGFRVEAPEAGKCSINIVGYIIDPSKEL